MRVEAEPTELFVDVNGVQCRVWNALTEDGKQMFLFVSLIATREDFSAGFDDLVADVIGDGNGIRLEKAAGS